MVSAFLDDYRPSLIYLCCWPFIVDTNDTFDQEWLSETLEFSTEIYEPTYDNYDAPGTPGDSASSWFGDLSLSDFGGTGGGQ